MQTLSVDTTRRFLKRAHVVKRLGKTLFMDSVQAGWLRSVAQKKPTEGSKRRSNASVFFLLKDVEKVEQRLAKGEYPDAVRSVKWIGEKPEAIR